MFGVVGNVIIPIEPITVELYELYELIGVIAVESSGYCCVEFSEMLFIKPPELLWMKFAVVWSGGQEGNVSVGGIAVGCML